MRITLLATLVATTIGIASASAQDRDRTSANYMLPHCKAFLTNSNDGLSFACAGTLDGLLYNAPKVCAPPTGTLEQLVRVVVRYIDQRPARMHENFKELALEAMANAWPCPKGR